MDIACLRNIARASASACASGLIRRTGEDERRIGARAFSNSTTNGMGSYFTLTLAAASSAAWGVIAATAATGCPAKRTIGYLTRSRVGSRSTAPPKTLDDMHTLHAGMALGGGCVDGENFA